MNRGRRIWRTARNLLCALLAGAALLLLAAGGPPVSQEEAFRRLQREQFFRPYAQYQGTVTVGDRDWGVGLTDRWLLLGDMEHCHLYPWRRQGDGPAAAPVWLMLHKPPGYACTLSDPHADRLVTELVAECGARVYPVGRLDVASEGLLLLTNDGDFANAILHPSHQVDKTYHVTVSGYQAGCEQRLAALSSLEGEPIRPAQVRLLSREGSRAVLEVVIHEGKKRQIRRMCRAVGLSVTRLCRVGEGDLALGDLPPGAWRRLTADEVAACKK